MKFLEVHMIFILGSMVTPSLPFPFFPRVPLANLGRTYHLRLSTLCQEDTTGGHRCNTASEDLLEMEMDDMSPWFFTPRKWKNIPSKKLLELTYSRLPKEKNIFKDTLWWGYASSQEGMMRCVCSWNPKLLGYIHSTSFMIHSRLVLRDISNGTNPKRQIFI